MRPRNATCPSGHENWYYSGDGKRRCKTCRNNYVRKPSVRRPSRITNGAGTGPEYALTREQVMKARGYV